MTSALDRARTFLQTVDERSADSVVAHPLGTVLRTPSLPSGWTVNTLRVDGPRPELTLGSASNAARAALLDLPYVDLQVHDEETGARLAAEAHDAHGWQAWAELLMVLEASSPPPPPPPPADVREGTLDEVLALTAVWLAEEGFATDARTVADLLEMNRRQFAAFPSRHLVADVDGRPAAMASVRWDPGRVAQVEDVFVLSPARGNGLGRAVVAAAVGRACAEAPVVVVVADDDGWPKELYGSFGFRPAARRFHLHREL